MRRLEFHAAIDANHLAGNKVRQVGGEKFDHLGAVLSRTRRRRVSHMIHDESCRIHSHSKGMPSRICCSDGKPNASRRLGTSALRTWKLEPGA